MVNLQSDLPRDKGRGEDSIVATLTAKVACEGGGEGGAAQKRKVSDGRPAMEQVMVGRLGIWNITNLSVSVPG